MNETMIVVPCYNEAERIDLPAFRRYLDASDAVRFLFVNDGSRDATAKILAEFAAVHEARCELLDLPQNVGKAEAVRQGMLHALSRQPRHVGFWDADLATPLETIEAFVELLERRPALQMVLGSRVRLLGRTVERRAVRHYLGRVFATLASLVLGLPVYDTQCGAKLFRAGPELARLLAAPFQTRWIFDVELLARFAAFHPRGKAAAETAIYELPLDEWRDVPGSKLRPRDFARAMFGLARIYWRYRTGSKIEQAAEPAPGMVLPGALQK
jgi:glycosyltransferase involved in cell wall biosynthesis